MCPPIYDIHLLGYKHLVKMTIVIAEKWELFSRNLLESFTVCLQKHPESSAEIGKVETKGKRLKEKTFLITTTQSHSTP